MNSGFKYFPEKLYSKAVKITAALSSAVKTFGMSKPSEIFYTVKDGDWNDISVWETVSGRVGKFPDRTIDDVYVKHCVRINTQGDAVNPFTNRTDLKVGNLFISGLLTCDNGPTRVLAVYGNIKCTGTINFTGSTISLMLKGYHNSISNFIAGTSAVTYGGDEDQDILDLSYYDLRTLYGGTKFMTSDLTVLNNLNIVSNAFTTALPSGPKHITLEIGCYNLTVNGNASFSSNANALLSIISKSGSGNILFIGLFSGTGIGKIVFNGNPDVEFRGGISTVTNQFHPQITGTGTWNFTTNNQALTVVALLADCSFIVNSGITVTNNSGCTLTINNSLNGASGTASFINKGIVYFNNASNYSMPTGTFDKDSFANTVGYIFNGNAVIPTIYITYQNLHIGGTGTKSLGINTTVNGGVTIVTGTFDAATFNLTVQGTTNCQNTNGYFSKSGAGNLLFIGKFNCAGFTTRAFFAGNPNIEFRDGFDIYNDNVDFGTGTITFTTNNQQINVAHSTNVILRNPVITGAITLTTNGLGVIYITTIDGTVAGSNLIHKGTIYFTTSPAVPMATFGTYDFTTFLNTVGYVMNGAFTVPLTTYQNLVLGGTGSKTFTGTTTLLGGITQIANVGGDIDLGSYDLTVNGAASFYRFKKTGAGNIIFKGTVNCAGGTFTMSGNPTIEFRSNINLNLCNLNTGTGTWTFSTNNMTITFAFYSPVIDCPILISGAITLTLSVSTSSTPNFNNTINGNNAASKFDNRLDTANTSYCSYKNATQPMITGLLECNAAANVFKYNALGAQAVKGGTYRTLELGGSGVKQLQGNVDWITAYSLTGTATLDLNGFTLS